VNVKEVKKSAASGREGSWTKNSKWHFHRDPQEGILIHDSEKNNNRNIAPTI
jgi:hypothetical protein